MKAHILIITTTLGLMSTPIFAVESKSSAIQPQTTIPTVTAGSSSIKESGSLLTDKDKFSYAIGWDIGERLRDASLDINPTVVAQSVKDSLSGATPLLAYQQRQEIVKKAQQEFMAKRKAEMAQVAEKNKQQGQAFLAANKVKPGVITTADGLQYKVILAGTGNQPSDNDEVVVEYEGKLINGQVFESTYKLGKPVVAKVSEVMPGWKEALKMMKAGSKWQVVIPSNLAYGSTGLIGTPIGPNETLIFDIKLVNINPAGTPAKK